MKARGPLGPPGAHHHPAARERVEAELVHLAVSLLPSSLHGTARIRRLRTCTRRRRADNGAVTVARPSPSPPARRSTSCSSSTWPRCVVGLGAVVVSGVQAARLLAADGRRRSAPRWPPTSPRGSTGPGGSSTPCRARVRPARPCPSGAYGWATAGCTGGLGLWVAAAAGAEGLLWPAERRIQVALAGGPAAPGPRRACRTVLASAGRSWSRCWWPAVGRDGGPALAAQAGSRGSARWPGRAARRAAVEVARRGPARGAAPSSRACQSTARSSAPVGPHPAAGLLRAARPGCPSSGPAAVADPAAQPDGQGRAGPAGRHGDGDRAVAVDRRAGRRCSGRASSALLTQTPAASASAATAPSTSGTPVAVTTRRYRAGLARLVGAALRPVDASEAPRCAGTRPRGRPR